MQVCHIFIEPHTFVGCILNFHLSISLTGWGYMSILARCFLLFNPHCLRIPSYSPQKTIVNHAGFKGWFHHTFSWEWWSRRISNRTPAFEAESPTFGRVKAVWTERITGKNMAVPNRSGSCKLQPWICVKIRYYTLRLDGLTMFNS